MKLSVVVVDDEPLGRRGIISRLAKRDDAEVVAECANGREAVDAIRRHSPDLVFLDVQMPGIDGFGVIRELAPAEIPAVIFVTAYDQHAVRAFDVHALDYLLKPIDDERFREAVDRARASIERDRDGELGRRVAALVGQRLPPSETPRPATSDRFAVRSRGRVVFVRHADIDWVEAEGDYVRLHAGPKSWLIRNTLSTVARDLGTRRFLRIHRSSIVNIDRVTELRSFENGDYAVLLRDGTELRLSRTYPEALARLTGR
jgi:two-component system LytT family response regulator